MTPSERAERAFRLLEDETLTEAFQTVERAYTEAWASSPVRDYEGQHELRLMLKALHDVRADLEVSVSSGKLEALKAHEKRQPVPLSEWRNKYR